MIEKNYGRYILNDGDAALRALLSAPKKDGEVKEEAEEEDTGETLGETFAWAIDKYQISMVVPTGIEPVLPT